VDGGYESRDASYLVEAKTGRRQARTCSTVPAGFIHQESLDADLPGWQLSMQLCAAVELVITVADCSSFLMARLRATLTATCCPSATIMGTC
jgi:hypothetical protein